MRWDCACTRSITFNVGLTLVVLAFGSGTLKTGRRDGGGPIDWPTCCDGDESITRQQIELIRKNYYSDRQSIKQPLACLQTMRIDLEMDLKSLAERLDQMPMYPYFTYSHVVVCSLYVRTDLGTGSLYFSRKHPLACWISTLICIFSSTILANFLLNEPVISALGNTQQVLWATIVWYAIFYSPFDIVYRLCNFLPIKILLNCMNEIHNCKAIYQGITHASKIFPDSYVIMAFVGIVKGNGPGFTRMFERLIRGTWSMSVLEFMHPSYSTKISALASIAFIVNKHSEWFMISQSFVFFCVVSASIYLRLSAILLDVTDPFSPFENLICLLMFGGIWDALAKALSSEDQSSRYAHVSNIRAKALRADILSRNGQQAYVAKTVPVVAPQRATAH